LTTYLTAAATTYRRLELENIDDIYHYSTTLAKLLSRLDLDKISDSYHWYRSQDVVTIYLTAVTTAGAKAKTRS
jgi:hypothetical protein